MSDDDLEARLRRMFADQADQAPPPGPVEQRTLAAVRRGPGSERQRRRRAAWFGSAALRPAAVAAAVLVVVGATAGGVALVRNLTQGTPTGTHLTGSSQSSTATSTATPTATPASSGVSAPPPAAGSVPTTSLPNPTTVGPTTGKVPKGFAVADLTFVTPDAGWALGTVATCARTPCTSLLHTTNGGTSWVGLAPPRVDLPGGKGCASSDCVTSVRFANSHIGYLYGPRTLYVTVDAGAHWKQQPGGADALEIAAGNVLRVTTPVPDCRPACTYLVQTSDVGGASWHTVLKTTGSAGDGAVLVRAQNLAFVTVYAHVSGGAGSAHTSLYSSTDAGQNWVARGEPCPQVSGAKVEYDATALAPAPLGSVTVLCTPRSPGPDPFVATSSNNGHNFVPGAPHAGLRAPISAASARIVFANAGSTGAVAGQLLRSTDAGKTWAVVATAPAQPTFGGFPFGFLGFENTTTGRWASAFDPYTIWTTRDAGASWSPYSFQ